jgi:hypothetical protein
MLSGEETMEEERWQRLEVWKHSDELAFLVYKVTLGKLLWKFYEKVKTN